MNVIGLTRNDNGRKKYYRLVQQAKCVGNIDMLNHCKSKYKQNKNVSVN